MARSFQKVLTDESGDAFDPCWGIDCTELGLGVDYAWSIQRHQLSCGKEAGVELLEIDNGRMRIFLCPTRGMGIIEARCDGTFLGWDSPVGEIVHPKYVDIYNRGGLGWLDGFCEWMVRCGLEAHGAPGEDVIVDNQGNETRSFLPLHGKIANIPASGLAVAIELDPPHTIRVVGEVYESMMFGPAFKLHTTIETELGSPSFRIIDRVENRRSVPEEMELLYHCNYGPPILGEGAKFMMPFKRMTARDPRALEGIKTWDVYGAPESGFTEQCYFFEPIADNKGQSVAGLIAPDGKTATSIEFSAKTLPWFTIWKCTGDERDGYVTGLEPGTDFPNNRSFERSKGRVVKLAPGKTYTTELAFAVHSKTSEVRDLKARIKKSQGKVKPVVSKGLDTELTG